MSNARRQRPEDHRIFKELEPSDVWQESASSAASVATLDVIFVQDSTMYDGRFSNNSWLQEVPDPITKLAQDNAALVSPQTARDLEIPESSQIGKTETSLITLTVNGQSVEMPAWIVPGMADNTVAVAVGYGRDFKGYLPYHENGTVGFDVNPLRTMAGPDVASGATVSKVGKMYPIACLQRFGSQTPGFGYPARALKRPSKTSASPRALIRHLSDPRPSTFGQATVTSQSLARSSIVTLPL